MSFREKLFIDKLHKDAQVTLQRIFRKRRQTFWGETPVLLRFRKYKVAGEIRNERVSVVKPQLHKVRLYSHLLQKFVPLETTPHMMRYIEACGGLDDYLLNTPDSKLHSDVASQLKVELLQMKQQAQLIPSIAAAQQPVMPATQQDQSIESAAQSSSSTPGPTGSPPNRAMSPSAQALQKARGELAAARRERITRMLEAAVNT